MPAAPAISDRFALIIEALYQAVARRIGPNIIGARCSGQAVSLAGPLIVLIVSRLRRFAARFTRLATAATCTQARLEAPRPARLRQRAPAPLQTPRRFAWLLRLAPETATIAAQLRHLLAEPEMTALLASIPQLRRTLRPLCQMLGIRPPLSLAAPPSTPRRAAPDQAGPCHAIPAQPPPIPPRVTLAVALPFHVSPRPAS